jgi:uncharacterized membrane protein (UPF0136 family)
MKYKGISVLIYSLLVLIGGILGYVKAQSAVSLMTGVLSSLFLCVGAFSLFKGKKLGFYLSTILTALLGVFFAYRFALTHSFMPAGLMCILSAIILIILLSGKKPVSSS